MAIRTAEKPKRLLGPKRKRQPDWLTKGLQGVAFWIGHRQSLYSGYPLTEAAQAQTDLEGRKTTGKILLEP